MRTGVTVFALCTVLSLGLLLFYNHASTKLWTTSAGKGQTLPGSIEIKELSGSLKKNGSKIQNGKMNEKRNQPQEMLTTRKNLIILSPGRSGSSFLGSFFDNSPRVMYFFEPLQALEVKIGTENYKETCIKVIDSFMKCNFSDIGTTSLSAFSRRFHRRMSKAAALLPHGISNPVLSKACSTYNHTVIKILSGRVPNNTIQTLIELFQQQNQYDVKLVHLVRDPRAVINSRVKLKWIKKRLDPSFGKNVHEICDIMLQNARFGLQSPPPWLKSRFKLLRYEDLALNTSSVMQELYRFAGFDWSTSVDEWISTLAKNTKQGRAYSLYRNVSAALDGWKSAPEPFIRDVENICGDLIDFLGYEKWRNQDFNRSSSLGTVQ